VAVRTAETLVVPRVAVTRVARVLDTRRVWTVKSRYVAPAGMVIDEGIVATRLFD